MGTRFSGGFMYPQHGHGALALTYQQAASVINQPATAVWSFLAQPIGAADASRFVFVLYGAKNPGGDLALNTLTIGGVTATILGRVGTLTTPNTNNGQVGMAYAYVPQGTTADIVFTFAGAFQQSVNAGVGIEVYTVVGPMALTPTKSIDANNTISPFSVTFDIPPGGVAFAIGDTISAVNTQTGPMTIDDAGTVYVSSVKRYAFSQVNPSNVNTLASQTENFTNWTGGGQGNPIMLRVFGRT